jgi:hypothetical protein
MIRNLNISLWGGSSKRGMKFGISTQASSSSMSKISSLVSFASIGATSSS